MDPEEVIIASSSSAVCVYDPNNGKLIKLYKKHSIAPKCLALLAEDYFIGGCSNEPAIDIWTVSNWKSEKVVKSHCEAVNALAATSCGNYCVAAVKQEIRVWNVRTGDMLTAFSRHYQPITCLRFASDDSLFLSGGKDGSVLVWMLAKVTSVNTDPERVKPLYTWNNHSKEVTDIFVGALGNFSRVATSSADMTCKVYELDTGVLLTTICMETSLTAVVMDPLEYHVILGSQNGSIYKVNLYYEQPRELQSDTIEKEVQAHLDQVTSLSVSILGNKFLSASADKTCKLWDITSLSCLFTFVRADGAFTNAFFALYPTPLLTEMEPYFIVRELERNFVSSSERSRRDPKIRVKLQKQPLSLTHVASPDGYYPPSLLAGTCGVENSITTQEVALSENLFQEALRGETVDEVRSINSQMYTYVLNQTFNSIEFPNDDSDD